MQYNQYLAICVIHDGDIYYSKEVKGQRKFLDHFCKYVFTCVNILFGGT